VSMHASRPKLWENSNSDTNSVGVSASRAVAETATGEKADTGRRKRGRPRHSEDNLGSQPRAAQVAAARTRAPRATRYNLRPRS
jgi:hypothetical protein